MEPNKISAVDCCKKSQNGQEIFVPSVHKWTVAILTQDTSSETEEPKTVATSEKTKKWWMRYIGILFAVLGSIVSALTSMMVKIVTREDEEYHYNPITVAIWRFQGILWPSLIVLLYCIYIRKDDVLAAFKSTDGPGKWKLLAFLTLRNLLGLAALVLKYYALFYMDMGDATVIALSTPVFVTFVAFICLGESCGIVPVFSALLTLCGVGIISRPPFLTGEEEFNTNILIGIAYSFSSMISLTLVFVILRKLRHVHFMFIIFLFGATNSCVGLAMTPLVHPFEFPRETKHWLLAAGLAALAFILQCCLTLSLKYEEAGPVALIRTSDVIFTFMWQKIFLGVDPDIFSYTGSTVVLTGILICVIRKWVSDLPEGHRARKKLFFLLI